MIKQSLFLMTLAALIIIGLTNSSIAAVSSNTDTNTSTLALELEPISSLDMPYQTAAVCFLGIGDCDQPNDYHLDSGKQCQNEGYTYTKSNCTLPNFLEGQCTYNTAYYQECKQDIPRACSEAGYKKVSECAAGQKLKATDRCPWDNNYGTCCKEACPANSSLTCGGTSAGDDTCGYTCKKCCSDTCPSGQQLYYTGSNGSKTECGNQCKYCNATCPSGSSTSYSGSSAGTNECGNTCRNCSSSCPGRSYEYRSGSGSCGGSSTRDECGSKTCYYPYETCPCYPSCYNDGSCSCGSYTVSNGCGGTCTKCSACCSETCSGQSYACSSSQIQTSSCSLKCGSGTRYSCKAKPACTPTKSESGCTYGTQSCSDGCGGTRTCCKSNPCSRSQVWYNGGCCSPDADDPYWIDDCNCTYCSKYASVNNGCGGTRKSCRREIAIQGCLCR